jgi:hypothetical protein
VEVSGHFKFALKKLSPPPDRLTKTKLMFAVFQAMEKQNLPFEKNMPKILDILKEYLERDVETMQSHAQFKCLQYVNPYTLYRYYIYPGNPH